MTITTGELDQLIGWLERRDGEGQEYSAIKTKGAMDLARELIAARKVVKAAQMIADSELSGPGSRDLFKALSDYALTAYDQARNPSEGE